MCNYFLTVLTLCTIRFNTQKFYDLFTECLWMCFIYHKKNAIFAFYITEWVLGAFEKLRKATISFVVFVCPSVSLSVRCPHGTTRLPLHGFLCNLIFDYPPKNLSRKFKFH
jgi:hypothetical protein